MSNDHWRRNIQFSPSISNKWLVVDILTERQRVLATHEACGLVDGICLWQQLVAVYLLYTFCSCKLL